MMRTLIAVLALCGVARAEPSLTLAHEPAPRHLRMRPRAAAATPKPTAAPSPLAVHAPDPEPDASVVRDTQLQRISARVQIGYTVDATSLTGQPTLSGEPYTIRNGLSSFGQVHAYGFGEASLGTRGVGLQSLSTYFAGQFQLSRQDKQIDPANPGAGGQVLPAPISTWFDRSGLEPRSGWAELADFLPGPLAPLRVRFGELYVYGPWVMHMYGALVAWEHKLVKVSFYSGSRVPDYTISGSVTQDRALIAGGSVRVDLRDLRSPIPVTIGVDALAFTAVGAAAASNHTQLDLEWRPRRDVTLIAQQRSIDGAAANEHVQFRGVYKQVTNFVIDLTHRHATDWRWDPSVIGPDPAATDPTAARRYLDLGPVLPQVLVSLRGGTLIAENVDVYARTAIASTIDTSDTSAYTTNYLEAGGAVEVRVRRTVAVALSGLTRQEQRQDLRLVDAPGVIDPLPASTSAGLGEHGFTEFGASTRMSLGARKFSAVVEIYGRRTNYAQTYCLEAQCAMAPVTGVTGIETTDLRGGGRFSVDAWIGKQVRLFASYELSTRYSFAPEISGYKSLKLVMEGVY